jgi:hypothetical protein
MICRRGTRCHIGGKNCLQLGELALQRGELAFQVGDGQQLYRMQRVLCNRQTKAAMCYVDSFNLFALCNFSLVMISPCLDNALRARSGI